MIYYILWYLILWYLMISHVVLLLEEIQFLFWGFRFLAMSKSMVSFSRQLQSVVFHIILKDNKSPQDFSVYSTWFWKYLGLDYLYPFTDLQYPSLFSWFLGTVLRAPTQIGHPHVSLIFPALCLSPGILSAFSFFWFLLYGTLDRQIR